MNINLEKELEKGIQKRKIADKTNQVLAETKGLLEYDTQRDIHILRSIGQNSTFVRSEEERGQVLEIEKKEQFYSGKVYTKDQIIALAVKYRLKFLESKHYKGYIPPAVIPEIKEMERSISKQMSIDRAKRENLTLEEYLKKEGGIKYTIDDHALKNNFYVLAPPSMFKTEKKAAFTIVAKDPIMFYSDDEKHFRLLKKWGSDFTIFRRFIGWLTTSKRKHVLFYLTLFTVLVLALSVTISWYIMWAWLLLGVVCVIVFEMKDFEIADDFTGKDHATSLNSYYM